MSIYIVTEDCPQNGNYISRFENRAHLYQHAIIEEGLENGGLTSQSNISDICVALSHRKGSERVKRVTRDEAKELFRWSLPKMMAPPHHPKYYAWNTIDFELAGFPKYVWA